MLLIESPISTLVSQSAFGGTMPWFVVGALGGGVHIVYTLRLYCFVFILNNTSELAKASSTMDIISSIATLQHRSNISISTV